MTKDKANIQDTYLLNIKESGTDVRILTINGGELVGKVSGFDAFTILLKAGGAEVMVYKSAVVLVEPV